MPIVVNSNTTASVASFNLASANSALRKSLSSLSSGKRIVPSADDAGGLAVANKIHSKLKRTEAVRQNIQNGLVHLQVQDSALESIGSILSRVSELRTMANDITKNLGDIENYTKEFIELQKELQQMLKTNFNGTSLFCSDGRLEDMGTLPPNINQGTYEKFCVDPQMGVGGFYPKYSYSISTSESGNTSDGVVSLSLINLSHIIEIGVPDKRYDYIWDQDNDGIVATNGSFNYSLTLGNIDYDIKSDNLLAPNGNQAGGINEDEGFSYSIMATSMAQITYCIEKLSDARAENGAEQARLVLSEELLTQNQVNLESAHGRIMDTDIALVSSRFAKQNVLVKSSAAMVAQANQLTNVALQILG